LLSLFRHPGFFGDEDSFEESYFGIDARFHFHNQDIRVDWPVWFPVNLLPALNKVVDQIF